MKILDDESGLKMNSFGDAIKALKQGKKVARRGWNGKNMWLFLLFGKDIQNSMNLVYGDNDDGLPILDSICMKTADRKIIVGWLASQTDILAKDWEIIK